MVLSQLVVIEARSLSDCPGSLAAAQQLAQVLVGLSHRANSRRCACSQLGAVSRRLCIRCVHLVARHTTTHAAEQPGQIPSSAALIRYPPAQVSFTYSTARSAACNLFAGSSSPARSAGSG